MIGFLFGSFSLEKNNRALPTKVRGAHQLGVQRVVECNEQSIGGGNFQRFFGIFSLQNWGR